MGKTKKSTLKKVSKINRMPVKGANHGKKPSKGQSSAKS